MELRHLRYFVAVAEERNFTRAAERLHIAQPPLSRQMQQLEEMLGVALIEKGSRPLRLTEAGTFFLAHARPLLAQVQDLKAMTQRVGKLERTLAIGFVASTLYGDLPDIVHRYCERHPEVNVTLHEMTTIEQIKALKEGHIDVGFGRLKSEDPSIRRIVLREERLVVALPPGHRLAEGKDGLRLTDLIHETLLVYPKAPRPSFADQVLAMFSEGNVTPGPVVEVRELQISMGLVAAGQGISIVPESVQAMHHRNVAYRKLDDKHAFSPILFSVRHMDHTPELENLLTAVYEIYDELGIAHIKENL
ncbi:MULTISPECIES: LysR family transcriptional regulator [unclassified Janthinobacterium]|uniref:LysR family transcriptional regulator n=1 Tax=unclassified Janthinobacterium TaxID=2610881 RepID=UPI0016143957|nr:MULTISPECIES: LysR family transcriptional regulator [unclassified Janthinobacterium]MBB5606635.1 DNA-binding transcriptional LysR family regulator [Janthinobacterium sp. S3T4]MBB5612315.1 DNA-binding transcriptional LysR family regulator [Janthinobacterium sp. S3M3]